MPIHPYRGIKPQIDPTAYVAPGGSAVSADPATKRLRRHWRHR
jgi:hypothetical protein